MAAAHEHSWLRLGEIECRSCSHDRRPCCCCCCCCTSARQQLCTLGAIWLAVPAAAADNVAAALATSSAAVANSAAAAAPAAGQTLLPPHCPCRCCCLPSATVPRMCCADLCSLSACDQGLAHVAHGKHGGGLHVIPVLLAEGVNHLLLASLLPLADTLVLTCAQRHDRR